MSFLDHLVIQLISMGNTLQSDSFQDPWKSDISGWFQDHHVELQNVQDTRTSGRIIHHHCRPVLHELYIDHG